MFHAIFPWVNSQIIMKQKGVSTRETICGVISKIRLFAFVECELSNFAFSKCELVFFLKK